MSIMRRSPLPIGLTAVLLLLVPASAPAQESDAPAQYKSCVQGQEIVLAVGDSVGGVVTAGGEDCFRIDLATAGWLEVSTSGATDTHGELYDDARSLLSGDNNGGPGDNFLIIRYVPAGTYYVEVRGFSDTTSGPYVLRAPAWADDAHSCQQGQETSLAVGDSVGGVFPPGNDQDCFRIDVTTAGWLEVSTSGTAETGGVLYDSAHITLQRDYDHRGAGDNFLIFREVPAGTYYVRVTGWGPHSSPLPGSWRYILRATVGADDAHSCVQGQETLLAVGDSVVGLLPDGDEDCFRIDLRISNFLEREELEVRTSGAADTYGRLYDGAYSLLEEDDDSGAGVNFLISRDVPAGTYYVKVTDFSGTIGTRVRPYVLRATARFPGPAPGSPRTPARR